MGIIKEIDDYIIFKDDTHQYFRRHDMVEFTSVSKFKDKFKIPFNAQLISKRMTDSPEEALELQEEWAAIGKHASDHGKAIHSEAENIVKFGGVKDDRFKKLAENLFPYLKMYKRNFSERICYHDKYRVAGTADWPALRNTQGKKLILDVNDFKTNVRKGIVNYTGKYDKLLKLIKYYNKYFLRPLEYLEASNYNDYVLQLSIYAFMLETIWDNVQIGALNIIFIDEEFNIKVIPAPYMRPQVIEMFEIFSQLKSVKDNSLINKIDENHDHAKALLDYSGETTLALLGGNTDGDNSSDNEYW